MSSVDQNIYVKLRDRLVSGEFEPGQRLRSDELKKDYNVSVGTVRELLFRLSSAGLVDFLEQRGFRVPEPSMALQHDLTQTRIMLECEGARLSISNGGVAWEARLTAAHHELKHIETHINQHTFDGSAEVLSLWRAAEMKFHTTLIEECQSELLKEFHENVYHRFRQQLIITDKQFAHMPENVEQHQSILQAVLKRDESLVRKLIYSHLSRHLTLLPEKVVSVASR